MKRCAFRNLSHLQGTASTARVLNLLRLGRENASRPEWRAQPMFQTPALNRSMIIKHRLRRDELDLFIGRRHIATKVVMPIDAADLKSGGRYLFVGEMTFERSLRDVFGLEADHPDVAALKLIDDLPSLDPFLLREQLRRGGFDPHACYFDISEADLKRMVGFVEREIAPLVAMCFDADEADAASVKALAAKILSNDPGDRLEALGATLNLTPGQYQEGLFCWKGFLYYKWSLANLLPQAARVADAVETVRASGLVDAETKAYLTHSRRSLGRRISRACDDVARMIRVYDAAYASLTIERNPNAFRDFLLDAPTLFKSLGGQLGVIQHIVSYWRFRFGPQTARVGAEELMDIFMDFEAGLAGRDETPSARPAVMLAA